LFCHRGKGVRCVRKADSVLRAGKQNGDGGVSSVFLWVNQTEEGGPSSLLAMRKKQGQLWGGERGNGGGGGRRREIKAGRDDNIRKL
jgi:hypothetical protein